MNRISLSEDREDEGAGFDIDSSQAFVASAQSSCRRCQRAIQVVCLYCHSGRVDDESLEAFRVQCLWAMDEALSRQLQAWPTYRWSEREARFLNYCPHCGSSQDEECLHEEPGQPFHDLAREVPEGVTLRALSGRVRLSGDYVADV
jgi:hypothetical protein